MIKLLPLRFLWLAREAPGLTLPIILLLMAAELWENIIGEGILLLRYS